MFYVVSGLVAEVTYEVAELDYVVAEQDYVVAQRNLPIVQFGDVSRRRKLAC